MHTFASDIRVARMGEKSETPLVMDATSLSIVIPSHCRTDLLRRCLASVQEHAPAGVDVIVVDDGSVNGAVSAVAEAHGVRCLRLEQRKGFCAAVNAGISRAQGAIVELLNDDTEVTAGWARSALAVFDDEQVAAVAPLVLMLDDSDDGPRIDSAGDRYYLGGVAGKRGHREPLSDAYLHPCRVFGASGSSAFYRRDALLRVGGFPESFGAYFEDVDLSFRLNRAGYEIRYEPASRVYHRVSCSYGVADRRMLEQQSLNEERVFWRNIPGAELPWAVPRHLAVLAAKAWRRWQEGTLSPFLQGRLRVLAELPALFRQRRHLADLTRTTNLKEWRVERRFWPAPAER